MEKDKLDYESLFYQVIGALINNNGGSLEQAMDEAKITDTKVRKEIKEIYNWDN